MNFKNFDLNYFVTLFFLLLSANANILSSSNVAWFAIMALMGVVALKKKSIDRNDLQVISVFSGVYLAFVSFRFFVVNDLETEYLYSDYLYLIKYIYLAFLVCVILKDTMLANIVKVMTHLTLVSFVFYALQVISGATMYKLFSTVNFPTGNNIPGYSNVLIFTFTQNFHDFSNSGFVWEPGAFGCFLVLTLMFHFFLNKFRMDAIAIVLIIANITTFSTTNYLGLLVLFFLAYRYRVPRINAYVLIMIPVIVALFIFVPFLGNKIVETYTEDLRDLKHLRMLEKWYHKNDMEIPLNRFSSMWYIIEQFGYNLVLGVSNKYNAVLNKQYTVNISNGVFDFIAKFGIVGLLWLLYRYGRFCLQYVVKIEYLGYCLLILLVLSFGEPILYIPLVISFLFIKDKQLGFNRYKNEEEPVTPRPHYYGRRRT